MKIALVFLLVALSSCYEPSAASCMSRCGKSCGQYNMADFYCLKQGLVRNAPGTVSAVTNFLFAYDRCKAMKDKSELIGSINNLKAVTGCPLSNILGNDYTQDDLNADDDVILQYLLKAAVDLLESVNIGPLSETLRSLLMKVKELLKIFCVSRLDGQAQAFTGINGRKALLKAMAITSPGLLNGVLQTVFGPIEIASGLLESLFGSAGLFGDVTNSVSELADLLPQTIGGLTSSIGGASGGPLGIVPELLGGATHIVSGLTSGKSGLLGGIGGNLGSGPGLLEGETHIVSRLTSGNRLQGGLTDAAGDVTDMVDELTSGLGAHDLLGAKGGLEGVSDMLGGAMSGVGGVTSVLDPITLVFDGSNGRIGEGTGMLSGVPSGFGGVTDSYGSVMQGIDGHTGSLTGVFGGMSNGLGGMTGIHNVVPQGKAMGRHTGGMIDDYNQGFTADVYARGIMGGVKGRHGIGFGGSTGQRANANGGFHGGLHGGVYVKNPKMILRYHKK